MLGGGGGGFNYLALLGGRLWGGWRTAGGAGGWGGEIGLVGVHVGSGGRAMLASEMVRLSEAGQRQLDTSGRSERRQQLGGGAGGRFVF